MYVFIESWNVKAEMDLRGHLVQPLNFKGEETEAQLRSIALTHVAVSCA